MKAVVYDRSATPDRMVLREVQKPEPGRGQVLVRIHAVSVNAADYRSLQLGIIPRTRIFGADIAGEVESLGQGASRFKPGDRVFGDISAAGFGGFAEYAAVPEGALAAIPAGVTFEQAAALPMAGIAALQTLHDQGHVRAGQKVLIYGSGGGVGGFAIQLARHFGAQVTAVCGAHNLEQARTLGAGQVMDYAFTDALADGRRYDLILAVNGSRPLGAYQRALLPGGSLVIVGGGYSQVLRAMLLRGILSLGGKKIHFQSTKPNRPDLEFLARLVKEGRLKVAIAQRFPLEQAGQVVTFLVRGHAAGKVIVSVTPLA
jgi:NADPH:quinone reductase-like Zn-dependent oxidoreductase